MAFQSRQLKPLIREMLDVPDADLNASLDAICVYPPRQSVNALISFFCDREEIIRWRAIKAMGRVMARLTEESMESARVVMRRLMWSLNDESGGIGWGSPEAMGEIMAQNLRLAGEFSRILRSYIRPDENFLEHETLQRGVLWGIGRLAEAFPDYLNQTDDHLLSFLESDDAIHRGYAAWGLGNLKSEKAVFLIKNLCKDPHLVVFFDGLQLRKLPVSFFADRALKQIAGL
ncbi:MAG: HEAT repeat domain-containing protein [Desulfobacteraceae bacterium]|nr:MAG: HEAT repeat domain-containing protein [Desulfobacteraceae bacterium]